MNQALALDANTLTLEDFHPMIHSIVSRFCKRYQTEREETLSHAYFAFCKACQSYNSKLSSFSTYLYQTICGDLYEAHRTLVRRQILSKITSSDVDLNQEDAANQCRWIDVLDSLSHDGKIIVKLTLETDLLQERLGAVRSTSPSSLKRVLTEILKDLGWTAVRIAESFEEITEALSE